MFPTLGFLIALIILQGQGERLRAGVESGRLLPKSKETNQAGIESGRLLPKSKETNQSYLKFGGLTAAVKEGRKEDNVS